MHRGHHLWLFAIVARLECFVPRGIAKLLSGRLPTIVKAGTLILVHILVELLLLHLAFVDPCLQYFPSLIIQISFLSNFLQALLVVSVALNSLRNLI